MWQTIETAPKKTKVMFLVKGFDVDIGSSAKYTTDPWAVWREENEFVRWPHRFNPTHWMPIPENLE